MYVRMIQEPEVLPALHLVWEVYAAEIAPFENPEAVRGFQEFLRYEQLRPRLSNGSIILFGAWEGTQLCGAGGIDNHGNILLLYVRRQWQRRGAGRQLMEEMCQFCAQALVITRITMRAFPSAVTAMSHLGMIQTGPAQTEGPETFVPMERMLSPGEMKPKKSRKKLIIGISAALVCCIAFVGLLAKMVYHEARRVFSDSYTYNGGEEELPDYGGFDDFFDGGLFGGDSGSNENEESASGIDAIQEYEEQGLSFEVKEESYIYQPDDTKTTYVDFEVYYPQIDGLKDLAVQEQVNQSLKECAMETVDRIYENPSLEIKERVLGEENPVLADYVEYKVTYLTKDYICVAFQDYSYEGSGTASYTGLRTANISLRDGTEYQVNDIVDLNDSFVKEWLEGMRDEADSGELLSELDTEELKKALSGEDTKEDTYQPAFFADNDGIEIGFSFRYAEDDENNSGFGWVTAPFDLDELEKFSTDSSFWDLVK